MRFDRILPALLSASCLLQPARELHAQELDASQKALATWFAAAPEQRTALPQVEPLTAAQAASWRPRLVALQRAGARQRGLDSLPANGVVAKLRIDDDTMPFVILQKGKRPDAGWPLFLCLHGGGGNPNAAGPHSWQVNDREWQAQQGLTKRVYPAPGLYVIPRMADDRRGRWWHDHNQQAFEHLITQCLLFREVDANRVYLMGISEGGYGAIRFAGNRPDRFAATGAMAAAEPLDTSPPRNMRNVATRIDIGERDTMFDRVGLARRMNKRLNELQEQDPEGYVHVVNVQAGRGHGIDYSLTPKWLAAQTRQPRPDRVVWVVRPFDSTVAQHHYWLHLPKRPSTLPLFLDVTLRDNTLAVLAEYELDGARTPATDITLHIRLDDQLADLDQPIEIQVNGDARAPQQVTRSLAMMARTLAERHDGNYCFCTELVIKPN